MTEIIETKANSRNTPYASKINFLYDILTRGLSLLGKMEKSKIDNLWREISDKMHSFSYFNENYYFDILNVYKRYVNSANQDTSPDIILAILLQRICGKGKSFEENARVARDKLKYEYNVHENLTNHIHDLIKSAADITYYPHPLKGQLILREIYLSQLTQPYNIFELNQTNIQRDCIHLTKLEFLQAQQAILYNILNGNSIYSYNYFFENFEIAAKENLVKYLPALESKININIFIQDVESHKSPSTELKKCFKIQTDPVDHLKLNISGVDAVESAKIESES